MSGQGQEQNQGVGSTQGGTQSQGVGSAAEFLRFVRDALRKCCDDYIIKKKLSDGSLHVKLEVEDWILCLSNTWVKVSNEEFSISVGDDRAEVPLNAFRNINVHLTHWRSDVYVDARGTVDINVGGWKRLGITFRVTGADSLEVQIEVEE